MSPPRRPGSFATAAPGASGLAGWRASLGALLLALAIAQTPLWRNADLMLFDLYTVASAPGRSNLPITIIGIDEASFAALKHAYPWPRGWHGRLLDRLKEGGAAVAAFDVVFDTPSADPGQDQAFAEAIGRFGPVVLAADLVYSETPTAKQWLRVDALPGLLAAGASTGIAAIEVDPDNVFRRIPTYRDAFWKVIVERFRDSHPETMEVPVATADLRLNYRGGPHTYTYIPYYQMLEPDRYLPAHWREFLKDNIVLIGRNSRAGIDIHMAQGDFFATPFLGDSGELTPGVELQATLLDNMFVGDPRRELPARWSYLVALLGALVAHLVMRHWRPLRSGLGAAACAAAIGGGGYALFVTQLLWLPVATALLTVALVYLAQGGVAYWFERRQRQRIKNAFSLYVSPEVVEEVIADPARLRLGGERREVTVMFTDLAGFTSISEKMPPEEVANLLNRHLTDMTAIIHRERGTVDKFIGDAVMAFWGAPLADPEQSVHAARAAIAMQESMARLRQEILDAGGPALHMRIGLHRGECIVGNMGSEQRFDYSAIGDTVNLASRLEGANKPYGTGILLSQTVADAVADIIPVRPVDTVRVKGKTQGVAIFTPCDSAELRQRTTALVDAYRAGDLRAASIACDTLEALAPGDSLAATYRQRLAKLAASGLPAGWDGVADLEK